MLTELKWIKGQTYSVNSSSFLLRVCSPQHEDNTLQIVAEPLHHSVSEHLPAFLFVGVGLVRSDSQHSVEEQHPWRADTQEEATEGLLKCSCVSSFNRLHLIKKYPVGPIQSDLHDQGAEILQCLRPALCTCSPNWKHKAWRRWCEKMLLDWFQL